jgi:superfamily II DNA or RNA helicase
MIRMPIPDFGQLVNVRQRPFVVQDVRRSATPRDVLGNGQAAPEHLVTLSSVEDDALGEELQVIWELEAGAYVHEQMGLPAPTGFDDPVRLDAFLDAVRWGAISSADVRALQAPFRSGITIEDYQLDPVVRAIRMPRANLLIADDVGLGKTIETGLVAQELLLRHRVRTILVVCPSGIQIQWQQQMRDKFGLEFRIVDSELMKQLRRTRGLHVNPWTHFPRLITSIDFLKRERPLRLMREALPAEGEPTYPRRFDLLIVDEAHNVAPSGAGQYATDSLRTLAIRALAPHFEHKLFLTATPHNGYPESFSALLELLDNQRFARGIRPDRIQLASVMVRRLKGELTDWSGEPLFPRRSLEAIEVAYTDAERRAHHLLHAYAAQRRQKSSSEGEHFATEFVLKLLKKRLFSSPKAFELTLARHERSIDSARKRSAAARTPSLGILRRQIDGIEEDIADDDALDESTDEALDGATRLFRELTPIERTLLQQMRQWSTLASGSPDSKTSQLLDWLRANLRPNGEWNDERVIIFTEYRDTQRWLQEILAAHGFTQGDRLMTLYGGMNTENRERVKAAFQAHPSLSPVRILLATDAASEGIDLQNYCSRLIHFEIPWNPNRMEQRNGRVDRHGQRAHEVQIFHFVGEGYQRTGAESRAPGDLEGDLEFLMRAAIKVDAIREDLGKVGPVIALQVEQAMLGGNVTLNTDVAEREAAPARALLKLERQLSDQIDQLHQQLQETKRELHLSPENIEHVVRVGLEVAGQPALQSVPLPQGHGATAASHTNGRAYRLPAFKGSWAACNEGLAHPHTGEIRPIVFDHECAKDRDDVVLVHLNHRLVQMCLRLLRAEVWSSENQKRLHRVTARLVPRGTFDAPLAIAHGRIVVLGGDNQRLHEEVIAAGGTLRHGRFARLNVGEVREALAAALPLPAPDAVRDRLMDLWPQHAESLLSALMARMGERTAGLQRTLEERATKEQADIRSVLIELRETILAELDEPEVQQFYLFKPTELEQLERNKDSLRARVERIPQEIEEETSAIRARYADLTPRLFPVAVTYLVPEGLT